MCLVYVAASWATASTATVGISTWRRAGVGAPPDVIYEQGQFGERGGRNGSRRKGTEGRERVGEGREGGVVEC